MRLKSFKTISGVMALSCLAMAHPVTARAGDGHGNPHVPTIVSTEVMVADAPFFGQHGFLPETVDLENSVNLHATFVASGSQIVSNKVIEGIRAVDLAPTIGFALGLDPLANADGRVLCEIFAGHQGRRLGSPCQ